MDWSGEGVVEEVQVGALTMLVIVQYTRMATMEEEWRQGLRMLMLAVDDCASTNAIGLRSFEVDLERHHSRRES